MPGTGIAVAIPPPPSATNIATTVMDATPTPEQYAAGITAAMPTSLVADSFREQAKCSVSDYMIIQKISQLTSWHQSMVTTG